MFNFRSDKSMELLSIDCLTNVPDWSCVVQLRAIFPASADVVYTLLTHPENARIFRHIDKCTYRRLIEERDNYCKIEVENESEWKLLNLKGRFRTRLLVEEDHGGRVMEFALQRGTGPLANLRGKWTVKPLDAYIDDSIVSLPGATKLFDDYSVVTLEQKLLARLPRLAHQAFSNFSRQAIVKTVEDINAELEKIGQGNPSLRPYAEVYKLEILDRQESKVMMRGEDGPDPDSVLTPRLTTGVNSECSNTSMSTNGDDSDSTGKTSSSASMAASSRAGVSSFPLLKWDSLLLPDFDISHLKKGSSQTWREWVWDIVLYSGVCTGDDDRIVLGL